MLAIWPFESKVYAIALPLGYVIPVWRPLE
jgi:nitrate reductase gamma subunit